MPRELYLWWALVYAAQRMDAACRLGTCRDLHHLIDLLPNMIYNINNVKCQKIWFISQSDLCNDRLLEDSQRPMNEINTRIFFLNNSVTCLKKLVTVRVAGLKLVRLHDSSPLVVLSNERRPTILEFLRSDHEPFLSVWWCRAKS